MSGAKLQKAIFLDRDGVINKLLSNVDEKHNPRNYVLAWSHLEFIPEALLALRMLANTDYWKFIVSNQSGIGRGWVREYHKDSPFPAELIISMLFSQMCGEISRNGGFVHEYMFCPHDTDEGCCCRKPKPGMIYALAQRHNINLEASWMIGDSDSDIQAGWNAGITNLIKIDPDVRKKKREGFPSVCFVGQNHSVPVMPNLLVATEYLLDESAKT